MRARIGGADVSTIIGNGSRGEEYVIDCEERMRLVVANLAARHNRHEPLWSRVSRLTSLGSTFSVALCRWAGFDAHTGRKLP